MTFEEIERLAFEGKPIEKKSDPHEKLLYSAMIGLYAQYRTKQINKNMARQQKLELKRDFEQAQWLHEKQVEAYNAYQVNLCVAAGTLCELEKAATDQPDEDVARLAVQCVAAMKGDHDMMRRFKKKRENYHGHTEI